MTKYVYGVFVPEDGDLDSLYSSASSAIARLKEYGPVPGRAVTALRAGKFVYLLPSEGDEHPQTHAVRMLVRP